MKWCRGYESNKKAESTVVQPTCEIDQSGTCSSTSIHILALIACDESAVKARFDLEVGSSGTCATVADIKKSLRTWMDEVSADLEVMLVSDCSTPLDDKRSFEHNDLPAELYVVTSSSSIHDEQLAWNYAGSILPICTVHVRVQYCQMNGWPTASCLCSFFLNVLYHIVPEPI